MAIERTALDSLQHRVDQIRATGNDDLAARAWHALSRVIRAHYVETTGRDPQHVTVTDLRLFLVHKREGVGQLVPLSACVSTAQLALH